MHITLSHNLPPRQSQTIQYTQVNESNIAANLDLLHIPKLTQTLKYFRLNNQMLKSVVHALLNANETQNYRCGRQLRHKHITPHTPVDL